MKKVKPSPKKPRAKKSVPPPTREQIADQELTTASFHVEVARIQVEKACAHLSGLVMPGDGARLLDRLREMTRSLKDARYQCFNVRGRAQSDSDFTTKREKHAACGGAK